MHRDRQDKEQVAEVLREVAKQAERAGIVIRRLRDFVKRREPERQSVDINDIVNEVVVLTNVECRHSDVRVRMKLGRRLPSVYADTIQIEQVLVNLVRNACEAMRTGDTPLRMLTIETLRRRGDIEICVSDSGPGIPPEKRERLFEAFFTTKPDGMGLGLSISRSIVEAHEGRIWATANGNYGTSFCFTLPTAWRAKRGRGYGVHRR